MDVGLNNRNTFEDKELKEVVFLVEATSAEQFNLWKQWAIENRDLNHLDTPIPQQPKEVFTIFRDIITNPQHCIEIAALEQLFDRVTQRNIDIAQSRTHRVKWQSVSMGFMRTIGKYNNKPVCVAFSFAYVNGHKIAFYECTSQVVHYGMVEKYLIERFQLTHDGYTRWNHTNASNFHNCVNSLDSLDVESRDTVYEGNKMNTYEDRSPTFIKR